MLQLYIIFGVLVLELFFLAILLLPLPPVVRTPFIFMIDHYSKALYILLVILAYFVFDFSFTMRHHQEKYDNRLPAQHADNTFLVTKFRSERNFYLVAFTFTCLIILFRVHSLSKELRDLQESKKTK